MRFDRDAERVAQQPDRLLEVELRERRRGDGLLGFLQRQAEADQVRELLGQRRDVVELLDAHALHVVAEAGEDQAEALADVAGLMPVACRLVPPRRQASAAARPRPGRETRAEVRQRCDHVLAGLEEAHEHVVAREVAEVARAVQDAVGVQRGECFGVGGRRDPGGGQADELAGVDAGLVVGVDLHADDVDPGQAQRLAQDGATDAAGAADDHAIRLGHGWLLGSRTPGGTTRRPLRLT